MKRFLLCSTDEPVVRWQPVAVAAETQDRAIEKYLRAVYSKDDVFRASVLDLAVNMTFVEQFYLASKHEHERFNCTGSVGIEPEIVYSRVRGFFADRPDLGECFVTYMETMDQSLIDDEMFEFIAVKEGQSSAGITVLDPDLLTEVE